jgi:arylsulfatase
MYNTARCWPTRACLLTGYYAQQVNRDAIYWHHEGNRALRIGDWKIVSESENDSRWELYNLTRDRIESRNLAPSNPARVKEMSATWMASDEEFRAQGRGAASK